jgi:O-antigen ligase
MLNISALLRFTGGNAVEKTFFLMSAFALLFTRKQDKIVLGLMAAELFVVYVLALSTPYSQFSWSIFLASLNQIIVFFIFLSGETSYKDQQTIWKLTAFLPAICAVLGVLYQGAGISQMIAAEYATGVPRYLGSLSAAAFTSALGMCGVFAAVQMMLNAKKSYGVLVILNLMILLAAGGRATLAVALVLSVISVLIHRGMQISTKLAMMALGLVAGIGVLGVFWSNLATRFSESGDSGRSVMWDYLKIVIAQYPDTGIGFGHQFFNTPREVEITVGSASAHNDYLRLSVELGTTGMIVFYTILTLAVLRSAFRNGRQNYMVILAFAGFLFLSNSDNALASPLEFPLIFLALLGTHEKPATRLASRSAKPQSTGLASAITEPRISVTQLP